MKFAMSGWTERQRIAALTTALNCPEDIVELLSPTGNPITLVFWTRSAVTLFASDN